MYTLIFELAFIGTDSYLIRIISLPRLPSWLQRLDRRLGSIRLFVKAHLVRGMFVAVVFSFSARANHPSLYQTPLDVNQVYTIASGVITKCPDSNAALLPSKPSPPSQSQPTLHPGRKSPSVSTPKPAQMAFTSPHSYPDSIPSSYPFTAPSTLQGLHF